MTPMPAPADTAAATTVAAVMHADPPALTRVATVGDARDWFAAGASRRLALVADAGRYVGALTRLDAEGASDRDRPVVEIATYGRTVRPGETAAAGRDHVLASDTRRVPVVDREGRLVGVLALTSDGRFFSCRDGE
jgi:CBS domain-containing protein